MSGVEFKILGLIPILPLLGFIINSLRSFINANKETKPCKKTTAFIACVGPLASFAITLWAFFQLKALGENSYLTTGPLFTWMSTPLFQVDWGFMLDPLSSVMTLVVTGVGSLIHIYSVGYMIEDQGQTRYFSYINLFLFFMLVLVLGDNLIAMFVGWEGVGLCSYLLIGFWFTDQEKAAAGKKAFVANRIGDFGFLIGIFLVLYAFTSQSQSSNLNFFNYHFMTTHKEIFAPFALAISLCLFTGATGKSAQIPLYVWLPDAMAGPTPVSALIHAATMVTAGIYMVARLFFIYEMAPFALDVIAVVGVSTAVLAALIAVTQTDIKKVLAYSTVSQLGYMFLALGASSPQSAVFHVVTHAFFKACLFLCAGSVIHALGHEQDIRKMGGLWSHLPSTAIAFLISTIAIAGIPPFAGFFSKDEILWNTYMHSSKVLYALAFLAAGLTAFYMFRLFVVTFLGSFRGHHHPHKLPLVMTLPVSILAFLAAIGGFMGVPEVLGGSNHFHHWLGYLTSNNQSHADHHTLELGLMGASTIWAVIMSAIAFFLYRRNFEWTSNLKIKFKGLYQLMNNKFYVDEIYNAVLLKPLHWISQKVLWKISDVKLVDGLMVHGWSDMARFGARLISKTQSGVINHYLIYLWAALILMIVYLVQF